MIKDAILIDSKAHWVWSGEEVPKHFTLPITEMYIGKGFTDREVSEFVDTYVSEFIREDE